MRVIGRQLLVDFMGAHADGEGALLAWLREVESAEWAHPGQLKARFPSASLLAGGRVVFNIRRNRYRLVAEVVYGARVVRVAWLGTHAEYDRRRF